MYIYMDYNIDNNTAMVNDIRETFYNTIVCVALENGISADELNGINRLQILMNVVSASLKRIRITSSSGFYTLRGTKVPACFNELFMALENTKTIISADILSRAIQTIATKIMGDQAFLAIIHSVINFYREMNGSVAELSSHNHEFKKYIKNPNGNKLIESIRETFYNTMISAANMNSNIIPQDDIINFEPYAIIGMPALSIIYNVYYSFDVDGVKLLDGNVISAKNCPIYKELFAKMFELKKLMKSQVLDTNQILLIKYKCVNNPSIDVPNNLKKLENHHINKITSNIIDIALDVSKLFGFRENFGKII